MKIHKKTTSELVSERPSPKELRTLDRAPVIVIVDNVRSLDNVGLLFRLCEIARVKTLYLAGYTGHPRIPNDERPEYMIARHEKRIEKTAVYALPHQPWEYIQDPVPLVQNLKKQGYSIVSLEQTTQSVPYHQTDYSLPIALIIGHERKGVRKELLDISDTIVEIPILGLGNSHNVAISTSIVLYQILEKSQLI